MDLLDHPDKGVIGLGRLGEILDLLHGVALSSSYRISTASDGPEALPRTCIDRIGPACPLVNDGWSLVIDDQHQATAFERSLRIPSVMPEIL